MSKPIHEKQNMFYQINHYSDITVKILKPTSTQTNLKTLELVFEKIVPQQSSSRSIQSWDPIKPVTRKTDTVKRTASDFPLGSPSYSSSASVPRRIPMRDHTPYYSRNNQSVAATAYSPPAPATLLPTPASLTDRKPFKPLIETPKSLSLAGLRHDVHSPVVQQEKIEPLSVTAEKVQIAFRSSHQDKITGQEDQQLLKKENSPLQRFPTIQTQFLFDEEIEAEDIEENETIIAS